MNIRLRLVAALLLVAALVRADDPKGTGTKGKAGDKPAPAIPGVSAIVDEHDKSLTKALSDYIAKNPSADDLSQAYLLIFEKAVDHDWFLETEPLAKDYMSHYPDGPVESMALLVRTMARATDGKFEDALVLYKSLLKELDKADQTEFGTNLGDTLARSATAAGEMNTARKVYESMLEKYGDAKEIRDTIQDNLDRLALVGKPSPVVAAKDIQGKIFRLAEQKGKYVLLDFWATWCGPCIKDLPNLKAAYAKYHDKGLEIVGISLDETPEPVRDFVKDKRIPWPQIHNGSGGSDIVAAFSVNNIPATFLVGPDGRIVRLELAGENLDKVLGQLLK
jgi:thiol-disulfide isomerase/thioredoxin